jgi:hypothetical protein
MANVKLCECGCGEPAAIAKKTDTPRGYIKGQPTRFRRGHQPQGQGKAVLERGYRAKRRAAGLCSVSGCPKPSAAGKRSCSQHLGQKKQYYATNKAAGLCVWYGCDVPVSEEAAFCPRHRARRRHTTHSFDALDETRYVEIQTCDFCGQPFNGEIPRVDHDRRCCPHLKHCWFCTRGYVHNHCNGMAIAYYEWFEKEFGVVDPKLTLYRDKFPVPRIAVVGGADERTGQLRSVSPGHSK